MDFSLTLITYNFYNITKLLGIRKGCMKKNQIMVVLLVIAALLILPGCGNKGNEAAEADSAEKAAESSSDTDAGYDDGIYFAQQDEFSERTGWKSTVTIKVEGGKIADVEWNAANVNAGEDKVSQSKSGAYGMEENGGAQAAWWEQAEAVEKALIDSQNLSSLTYNEDGYTDAVSGVSIHINDFVELAEEALENGPVGRGMYKDGAYHAEIPEFSHGWQDYVDLTVINGYLVAARWDAYPEEGEMHKHEYSKAGKYGMVENGGAQAQWWEQVDRAEAYLLKIQDPTKIEYLDEDGHVDSISGVSIHVKELFSLAEEALKDAR